MRWVPHIADADEVVAGVKAVLDRHGVARACVGVSVNGFGVSVNGFGVSVNGFGVSVNGFRVSVNGFGVSVNGFGVSVNGFEVSVNGFKGLFIADDVSRCAGDAKFVGLARAWGCELRMI
jgi:hypothetical protein